MQLREDWKSIQNLEKFCKVFQHWNYQGGQNFLWKFSMFTVYVFVDIRVIFNEIYQ